MHSVRKHGHDGCVMKKLSTCRLSDGCVHRCENKLLSAYHTGGEQSVFPVWRAWRNEYSDESCGESRMLVPMMRLSKDRDRHWELGASDVVAALLSHRIAYECHISMACRRRWGCVLIDLATCMSSLGRTEAVRCQASSKVMHDLCHGCCFFYLHLSTLEQIEEA